MAGGAAPSVVAQAEASRAVKLCGTEQVDPPSRQLKAGALSVELENGQLRYVTFGGVEVLRAIAYLVRDENWGTFTPAIEDLKIDERPDSFTVTYRATCKDDKRMLAYDARITGASAKGGGRRLRGEAAL